MTKFKKSPQVFIDYGELMLRFEKYALTGVILVEVVDPITLKTSNCRAFIKNLDKNVWKDILYQAAKKFDEI